MKKTSFEIQWPINDLPKSCVYSMDSDYYSQFYEAEEVCKCGSNQWESSKLIININEYNFQIPPKRVQICSKCKEVRNATLKKIFLKAIDDSDRMLNTILGRSDCSPEQCWFMLKNLISNLEIFINQKNKKVENQEKIVSIKNFCENVGIDENLMREVIRKMPEKYASKSL